MSVRGNIIGGGWKV